PFARRARKGRARCADGSSVSVAVRVIVPVRRGLDGRPHGDRLRGREPQGEGDGVAGGRLALQVHQHQVEPAGAQFELAARGDGELLLLLHRAFRRGAVHGHVARDVAGHRGQLVGLRPGVRDGEVSGGHVVQRGFGHVGARHRQPRAVRRGVARGRAGRRARRRRGDDREGRGGGRAPHASPLTSPGSSAENCSVVAPDVKITWALSSDGENASTCPPWVAVTVPSSFSTGFSTATPTERAAFLIASKSPVSPMKRSSNAWSHLCTRLGLSRAGSVVTKTTRTRSWSASGSFFTAVARSASVVGHTS